MQESEELISVEVLENGRPVTYWIKSPSSVTPTLEEKVAVLKVLGKHRQSNT